MSSAAVSTVSGLPTQSVSFSASATPSIAASHSLAPSFYARSAWPSVPITPTSVPSVPPINGGGLTTFTFNPYSTTLAILYGLIALPILFQIGRILYNRHNIRSFQFSFLALSLFWALLRCTFWMCAQAPIGSNWGMNLLYWLPFNMQFTTFCLLILFYASMVHKNKWQAYRRYYWSAVWISSLLLLIMTTVWYYVFEVVDRSNTQQHYALENISQYFDFVLWVLLAAALIYYSWRLAAKIYKTGVVPGPLQVSGISERVLLGLNIFIAIVFFVRSILGMLAAIVITLQNLRFYKMRSELNGVEFVVFAFWDLTPTLIVLFLFRRIPTVGNLLPTVGQPYTKPLLFENPQRYDLDEDESSQEEVAFNPRFSSTALASPPLGSPFAMRFDGSFHMPEGYRLNSVN